MRRVQSVIAPVSPASPLDNARSLQHWTFPQPPKYPFRISSIYPSVLFLSQSRRPSLSAMIGSARHAASPHSADALSVA